MTEPDELDRLQTEYSHALDNQDLARWLSLFSEQPETSYVCTTREHVQRNLPLALMLDDCRARIEDRVTYITKIWAGTFQNYQTRHLTQRISAKRTSDGSLAVVSHFVVYLTPEESGVAEILTTGEYHDIITAESGKLLFASRKAILDTSVLPRYIVYPI